MAGKQVGLEMFEEAAAGTGRCVTVSETFNAFAFFYTYCYLFFIVAKQSTDHWKGLSSFISFIHPLESYY